MRGPSAIFVKFGLKACFLTAFCDAYIRGWLPLFECPEEWSSQLRPDVICQSARDGIPDGATDFQEVASLPFLKIDDDQESDIVREERDRLRNMIRQWVARASIVENGTDCNEDGDMYAVLGRALRGVSMSTAEEWDMPASSAFLTRDRALPAQAAQSMATDLWPAADCGSLPVIEDHGRAGAKRSRMAVPWEAMV